MFASDNNHSQLVVLRVVFFTNIPACLLHEDVCEELAVTSPQLVRKHQLPVILLSNHCSILLARRFFLITCFSVLERFVFFQSILSPFSLARSPSRGLYHFLHGYHIHATKIS